MSKHLKHACQLQVYENKISDKKKKHSPFCYFIYKIKKLYRIEESNQQHKLQ